MAMQIILETDRYPRTHGSPNQDDNVLQVLDCAFRSLRCLLKIWPWTCFLVSHASPYYIYCAMPSKKIKT